MSLLSLASVAVARDFAAAGQPLSKGAIVSKLGSFALGTATGQPVPAAQASAPTAAPIEGRPNESGQSPAGTAAGFAPLLVAQIPSEALLAYTTLLALFSIGGVSYNTGRWGLYGAAIVACAVTVLASYLAQRDYGFDDSQTGTPPVSVSAPPAAAASTSTPITATGKLHPPYLPVLAAVLSMAVYGLTVPGSPLQFEVSRTGFAIVSGCLAVGGGVMMSILAPFLGKGNTAKPIAK